MLSFQRLFLLGAVELSNTQAVSQPKQGRASLLFLLVLGQILALLFVFALARLFFYDRSLVLIWINMYTLYFYLPAYLILVLALALRQKALAAAAVGIIIFHLFLVVPTLIPTTNFGKTAPAGETVRLFNANLLFLNEETDAMIAEIEQADADVLVFQEYTPAWDAAFNESWMAEAYPYRLMDSEDSPFGAAIWSKRPLTDTVATAWGNTTDLNGTLHTTIEIDGQPVRLQNVHPPPPFGQSEKWNAIRDEIRETAVAEPLPLILIGDLNMTQHNRQYKALLNEGFYSLHQELGKGMTVSWPNGTRLLPPPVRLDHAFISPELVGVSLYDGIGAGSDHRPFVVDVALGD